MKFCPNCGKELAEGITRCWNKDCKLELLEPNKYEVPIIKYIKPIEIEKSENLIELELEHKLAYNGLIKGMKAASAAMLSGFFTLMASGVVLIVSNKELLTGIQLVLIFAILATAIIIYFAFVFGRAAKIKVEISKEKKKLEVDSGKTTR